MLRLLTWGIIPQGFKLLPARSSLGSCSQGQRREGDLWIKDLPDGEPRRFTDDGKNSEPRWSASGQWVAFRKIVGPSGPVEVWVVNLEGTTSTRLNQGNASVARFAWAPERDQIAFVSTLGSSLGALEAMDASGAERRELVSSGVGRFAWSPDGTWIAFEVTEVVKEGAPPNNRRAALYRVRPHGSDQREILNAGTPSPDGLLLAGWVSNGEQIIYWVDPGWSASWLVDGVPVFVIAVAGGEPRQVAPAML